MRIEVGQFEYQTVKSSITFNSNSGSHMLKKNVNSMKSVCLAVVLSGLSSLAIAKSKLDTSVELEQKIDKESAATQQKIDRLAEQALDMNQDYKSKLTQIEQYKAYNRRMELSIEEQNKEMQSLQNQMDTIDETERGLMPLMDEMIDRLANFVDLDAPFKRQKRLDNVDRLRNLMLRADISTSEKYRQILSSYTQELAFGTGVEVYEGTDPTGETEKQVDFLMFGRTSLMFATRGVDKKAAVWVPSQKAWQYLDSSGVDAVVKAIKDINLKSKKLILIPVVTPEKA